MIKELRHPCDLCGVLRVWPSKISLHTFSFCLIHLSVHQCGKVVINQKMKGTVTDKTHNLLV